MKKLVLALTLTLASSAVLAQPPGGPQGGDGHPMGQMKERMKDELGLTDEQVKKMREIRDAGGSREDMQAVLTPEQKLKMAEMRKEHEGDLAERKERMQKELGLSDEQVAKIDQIRQSGGSREEMRAVLTPEQQAKWDAKKDEMRSKWEQYRKQKAEGQAPMPGGQEPATK